MTHLKHGAKARSGSGFARSGWSTRGVILAGAAAIVMMLGATGEQPGRLGKKDHSHTSPTTQPPSQPGAQASPKSFLDDVLRKGRTHDWTLRASIHLDSYQDPAIYTFPGQTQPTPARGTNSGLPITIVPFKFDTAAVVFPAIKETATSKLAGDVSGKILLDQHEVASEPTWIENLPSGARYGRWDMKNLSGRAIDFDVEIPITTWEVVFNEQLAARAKWPTNGAWSAAASSSLGAVAIGQLQVIDPSSPAVREALNNWTAGKPPQSIPPVQLAKFLAGRVLEAIQPSGDGLISSRTGLLQGFYLRTPEATLKDGQGSEHDIACALCSVYRAAGLPARVVIGYDVSETKRGQDVGLKQKKSGGAMRSWVEFCLVDETVTMLSGGPKEIWVPVDIVRQRKSSNKAPGFDRPWKFFGNNDDTDDVIPIAFNYHPPLSGVIAHGSPCFWGWMTTPEMQTAEQTVRFTTITTPRTFKPTGGGNR